MFSLKFKSLLQFDQSKEDEKIKHNLSTLYGVDQAPSDTYMRERLDDVDPKYLRKAFKVCFSAIQRGKVLPLFNFIDGYVLISCDGTGFFSSQNVHCKNCCTKKHTNGTITYQHQMMCAVMVHPDQKIVIPVAMEPIQNSDGRNKNDCEISCAQRLLSELRTMHPKLKMVIVEDALHSNAPHIKQLRSLEYQYIIGVKPNSHSWLFDYVNASDLSETTLTGDKCVYKLRWHNDVPLNSSNEDTRVNFLECTEINSKNKTRKFTWITSFKITEDNVFPLMKGARSRWKIENETFNTLKTQDYHFEHNFGHGYRNLSTIMGMLMMLAFLVDQIQQLCCPEFSKALQKCIKRIRLWAKIREWFTTFFIESWEAFFEAIANPPHFRLGWGYDSS